MFDKLIEYFKQLELRIKALINKGKVKEVTAEDYNKALDNSPTVFEYSRHYISQHPVTSTRVEVMEIVCLN